MEITLKLYKAPANKLVQAVQEHCQQIIKNPADYGVEDFYALEDRLWEFIQENAKTYPRCPVKDLSTKVYHVQGVSEPFWSFTLKHKNDNILNTISLHAIY